MTALDFVAELLAHGVTFSVDGDRLRVHDPDHFVSPGERGLLSALKASILALLRTELPAEQAEGACLAFSAATGVAICPDCGFGLPAHYWRTPTCEFYVGTPADAAICRRCGVPWLEHRGLDVQASAVFSQPQRRLSPNNNS